MPVFETQVQVRNHANKKRRRVFKEGKPTATRVIKSDLKWYRKMSSADESELRTVRDLLRIARQDREWNLYPIAPPARRPVTRGQSQNGPVLRKEAATVPGDRRRPLILNRNPANLSRLKPRLQYPDLIAVRVLIFQSDKENNENPQPRLHKLCQQKC